MQPNQVHIYTDGAAKGNPGPGGYGVVMEWVGKPYRKEFSAGFRHTTNNRMELLAVIVGLEQLKNPKTPVLVISDSKYVVDAVAKNWVFGWEKKGFAGKKIPISGSAFFAYTANITLLFNGSKATTIIRKTNAVMYWPLPHRCKKSCLSIRNTKVVWSELSV